MAKKLNLNADDSKKIPKMDPNNPEDAMSAVISSLVSIATYMHEMSETLKDIQPILFDMKEFKKRELLNKQLLTEYDVEEIEKDEDDDEQITGS